MRCGHIGVVQRLVVLLSWLPGGTASGGCLPTAYGVLARPFSPPALLAGKACTDGTCSCSSSLGRAWQMWSQRPGSRLVKSRF